MHDSVIADLREQANVSLTKVASAMRRLTDAEAEVKRELDAISRHNAEAKEWNDAADALKSLSSAKAA